MLERLQKIISQAGITSRRDAENLILSGRVTVNGKKVTELGVKFDKHKARIAVDGKVIKNQKYIYILLNKPKGVVTTSEDPQGRTTVIDLIKDVPERIYPVGRLDYNTEGLLLLTNDGDLTHKLIHPSHKVFKTYIAEVSGLAEESKLDLLRIGVKLVGDGVTAPAQVHVLNFDREKNTTTLEIIIGEGKNRQIRRMCEIIGHRVKKLKRVKFAFLTLEGLRRGQYRHLTQQEIVQLKQLFP